MRHLSHLTQICIVSWPYVLGAYEVLGVLIEDFAHSFQYCYFLVRPPPGARTLKFSLVSAFFFCVLLSPSPHFSRNPRTRIFWFFASTLVSGNVKRWRFWIFLENSQFGHFGQFLAKNGLFWHILGYLSKTTHQILIIFCIKLTHVIRKWKQLVVTVGKLCFGNFVHFRG